ncbi:DUF6241 domain-containing protein [Bacillus sp. S14(2024)]|uniref:DUF6241 domain-containing protein n=1 Tax=Bacillus sp. S14(2024) TaxID=3162884 RepID=UPI003D19561E
MANAKKILKWTSITLVLSATVTFGIVSYVNNLDAKPKQASSKPKEEKVEKVEAKPVSQSSNQSQEYQMAPNKSAKEQNYQYATDTDIESRFHEMTHQKVIADERWGYIPMTPENIEAVIKLVESNKDQLHHYDFYIQVLNKWKSGDFSNCVDVHNQVWEWQGGQLGKATRLATAQEEQDYINKKTVK